jgi:hypothetical protein
MYCMYCLYRKTPSRLGGGGILIDVIWQIKYVKREVKKRNIEEKGGNTKDNREIKS